MGGDAWAVMFDDFKYADEDMTKEQMGKTAYIDSANPAIGLPEFVFNNTLKKMQDKHNMDFNVTEETQPDGRNLIRANKPCP